MPIKRKLVTLLLVAAAVFMPSVKAYAQTDFSFALYGGANNFWSNTLFQFPSALISEIITGAIDGEEYTTVSYRYELFNIKEGGEKVNSYKGRFFGFRAKDLFSDIHYGLKVGWVPKFSPFGVYVSCAYQYRMFEAEFSQIGMSKYRIHSVRPGVGIRLTPFISLLEDDKLSPFAEMGTSYNYYFGAKAPFGNDKKQFNSGMISTFALGVRSTQLSITGGVEIDHYSLFNKEFSPDNGVTHPYEDVKTNKLTIFLTFGYEFN